MRVDKGQFYVSVVAVVVALGWEKRGSWGKVSLWEEVRLFASPIGRLKVGGGSALCPFSMSNRLRTGML